MGNPLSRVYPHRALTLWAQGKNGEAEEMDRQKLEDRLFKPQLVINITYRPPAFAGTAWTLQIPFVRKH